MRIMYKIALDGPSGGGKSTLAKMISAELGCLYVDTGALYRSVALYVCENGIDPHDAGAVISALDNIKIEMKHEDGKQHVYLNGRDVGDSIRTPQVSACASITSAIPEVRAFLLGLQKDIAKTNNVIMDGRDIGTVIFPDAQVKIYLFASPEKRAERRYLELKEKGVKTSYGEILAAVNERDKNDSERTASPAVAAPDAVPLDNSELDLDGTFRRAMEIIREKLA